MGLLTIININRNEGATTQIYLLQFRKEGDTDWTDVPRLSYDQAQPKSSGGVLPIKVVTPDDWTSGNIELRMGTICNAPSGEEAAPLFGDIQTLAITAENCT